MFANRWTTLLAFTGLCAAGPVVFADEPAGEVDISTAKTTSLMLYQDQALVRKTLTAQPDEHGELRIIGMPDDWRYDSLELDYPLPSGSVAPLQLSWQPGGLNRDALYRQLVGKSVELLGGGLNVPVQGTLLSYRSGLALVQGTNGRQYLVDWDDPQGIRVAGRDPLATDLRSQSYISAVFKTEQLPQLADKPLRLSYVTPLLHYSSHYRLTLAENGKARIELNGLLTNSTNFSYEQADIRLISGDIGRRSIYGRGKQVMMEAAPATADPGGGERVGEMLVQRLPEGVQLPAFSNQQVSLMRQDPLQLEKIYILDVYGRSFTGRNAVLERPRLSYRFKADMDLPAAVIKLYEEASDGTMIISGESWLSQTTRGDYAHLNLREAQAVRIERSLTDSQQQDKVLVSQWNVMLMNDQDEAVTVVLVDRDSGLMKISEVKGATLEGKRNLKVQVPAKGKTRIGYHVRYSL